MLLNMFELKQIAFAAFLHKSHLPMAINELFLYTFMC